MRTEYFKVFSKYFPDCLYKYQDNVYETLEWEDTNPLPKPTKSELENLCKLLKMEIPFNNLREIRNNLLKDTDYIFTTDFPINAEKKTLWEKYRQDLRDLPSNQNPSLNDDGKLVGVIFPKEPI